MTTTTAVQPAIPILPTSSRRLHRPLLAVSIALVAVTLAGIAGALFDDRDLLGHPIWMKPLKFAISFALYCVTLAWMLSLQTKAKRLGWWMGTVVAIGVAVEMVLIVGQVVVRGRQLHFNMSTPTDTMFHNIMALTVYVIWAAVLVVAIQLLFDKPGDKALRWSIRLALGTTLGGMLLGNLMFRATPASSRQSMPPAGRTSSVRTRSASKTAAPACRSPAGAPKAATCGSATSSASTRCSSSR